jgi:hypothetical protein
MVSPRVGRRVWRREAGPGIVATMNREPIRLRYARSPKRDPWNAHRERWLILGPLLILLVLFLITVGYGFIGLISWWLGSG